MPGGPTTPRICGTSGTSKPASFSVGTSGKPGRRRSLTCAMHAQLAGAHLLARLARIDDHHVDVAAEQRGEPLAAGRERDERPARAGRLHQQLAHDVLARGDRAARLLELAGLVLRGGDEIGERLERRIRLHHDQRRLEHQARDRRHVLERLVGRRLLHQRVGEPDVGEAGDDVRVALLLGDVGGRRGAAAARPC